MKIYKENMKTDTVNYNSRKTSLDTCDACMTLNEALNDKRVKVGFRKFLESEFSVENLDFWLAVEQYKKITNEKLLRAKADDIYDEYVSSSSPCQVNLDHHTRQDIAKEVTAKRTGNTKLFNVAQKYIFTIMENDSYARFVRSKYYDICNQAGRRSPRQFLQDILQNTTKSRKRSPSPNALKGKRLSESSFIENVRST